MYYTKIIVQYRDGSKTKGAKVSLGFSFLSGITKDFYTDDKGIATIEHASKGEATIFVKGKKSGSIYAPGESVVFIE